MKTSERIIRSTHFIAMLMGLLLLAVSAYLLGNTFWFTLSSMWESASLDNLIEGSIVRVLDTIIVIEMIFVVLSLDHKQHLNVGMALDVAATITIRELVLAIYAPHSTHHVMMILFVIAVLVLLRIIYTLGKRRLVHE